MPRDNRAFAAYAKKQGLEYNLGETTDNFNRQHARFVKEQVIKENKDNLPILFDYISYKKGTDMLVESQQYKLCTDLLDEGYTVYINDIDDIIKQVETILTTNYGSRVKFGTPKEKVFAINF